MFAMRSQLNGVERPPLPLHFYCFAVATQVSQTLRQAVPDSPSNPAPPATQGDQRLIFQNIERSPKVYNNARLLEPPKKFNGCTLLENSGSGTFACPGEQFPASAGGQRALLCGSARLRLGDRVHLEKLRRCFGPAENRNAPLRAFAVERQVRPRAWILVYMWA